MKKINFIMILLIFLFIYIFFLNNKEILPYKELRLRCKVYKTYYQKDKGVIYNDTIDLSSKKSDPYSFIYLMNLGEYDSIYYFGDYPMPIGVKYNKPELYGAYKKYYSHIFFRINDVLGYLNRNYYVVYALYRQGEINFCKTRHTANNVRIIGDNFMLLNNRKYIVHGMNFKQSSGEIDSEVSFELVDNKRPR